MSTDLAKLLRKAADILEEEDIEQGDPVDSPNETQANRIIDSDRTPIHSDVPSGGSVVMEYGANPAIKKHMNRQLFGALQKSKARRNRKVTI
jgi:hypothetical protein